MTDKRTDKYSIDSENLSQLFDVIRIIDPLTNEIIDMKNPSGKSENKCYKFWNKNEKCENCIAMRAYNENSTFVKIEYNGEKLYWVMAAPVKGDNKGYVIETLKDITTSQIITDVNIKSVEELYDEIKKMNKLVITDELTNCYNRRFINEMLPIDIKNAIKSKKELALVIMDMDYFKNINDKYSHLCGDFILEEVVKIINNNIRREYDWIARYGGEEFVMIFKNSDYSETIAILEKIKSLIEKHNFIYDNEEINITASFGVAMLNEHNNNMERLIEEADKNLYKAKELGRNLIIG